MKKTALLTITGLLPFGVLSQPVDLINNFVKEREDVRLFSSRRRSLRRSVCA